MGMELLDLQSVRMLRELDGDSQRQCVFLALLGIMVLAGLSLGNMDISSCTKGKDAKVDTDPNTETCTVVTLQSANLGEIQRIFVPNLSIDSNLDFVRLQRIGIILGELDATKCEWTVGVEEKRAISEWKLESGIGSVFWIMTTTRPMWVMRFVGMVGSVGMVWLMGMIWLVRMVWFVGVVGLVRVVWPVGRVMRRLWMIRRVMRGLGMMWRCGTVGAVGFVVAVRASARRFNLHRLRPMSVLVAFQFLVGIESGLKSLSALYACFAEAAGLPIGNPQEQCQGLDRGL